MQSLQVSICTYDFSKSWTKTLIKPLWIFINFHHRVAVHLALIAERGSESFSKEKLYNTVKKLNICLKKRFFSEAAGLWHVKSSVRIPGNGCLRRLHTFFWKKYLSEHYWKAASSSQFNKNIYQKHMKTTYLLLALSSSGLLRISWKLSKTFQKTGPQRHNNLSSAESLTHFALIATTGMM